MVVGKGSDFPARISVRIENGSTCCSKEYPHRILGYGPTMLPSQNPTDLFVNVQDAEEAFLKFFMKGIIQVGENHPWNVIYIEVVFDESELIVQWHAPNHDGASDFQKPHISCLVHDPIPPIGFVFIAGITHADST